MQEANQRKALLQQQQHQQQQHFSRYPTATICEIQGPEEEEAARDQIEEENVLSYVVGSAVAEPAHASPVVCAAAAGEELRSNSIDYERQMFLRQVALREGKASNV